MSHVKLVNVYVIKQREHVLYKILWFFKCSEKLLNENTILSKCVTVVFQLGKYHKKKKHIQTGNRIFSCQHILYQFSIYPN